MAEIFEGMTAAPNAVSSRSSPERVTRFAKVVGVISAVVVNVEVAVNISESRTGIIHG